MPNAARVFARTVVLSALALATTFAIAMAADRHAQLPTLNDMSPAGLRAAAATSADPQKYLDLLPEGSAEAIRSFIADTRRMGVEKRSSVLYVVGPPNVQANNVAGDRIGETQSEIAVCVLGDTVLVGWNDSFGFTAGGGTGSPGPPTLSSFGYSTNGGASFTDGGNVPLALATDQAFGDPGVDTDEQGNWYYNQIYTRTGQQDIGVHHGRFNGAGVMVWDIPTMASIGTSATGNLDKCLLACDRVTGNVYVAYTRFTATPQIEIVRSTTLGLTWGAPIILDATTTPTSSKQGARPYCGPGGEVYVVWEKGANLINCPDAGGNVGNPQGQIAFTRSLNFGASYDPFTIIGNVDLTFMASGPGDLRERGNEFPDIAVDRSAGCFRGNIYVTWHEAGTWTTNMAAGPAHAEAADAANNNPGGAEPFVLGEDVTGTISSTADLDYWTFSANQGDNLFLNLDPGAFNCGVSGTTVGMRMRMFATQSPYPNPTGFPDSLLAASAQGTFADRIVWTCPKTGSYLIRLQRSSGTTPFTYRLRMRTLTFTGTSPARDARDITLTRSSNQGLTWSAEQRINDDVAGLENRRPFVATNNTGQVSVFWHDSRDPGLGTNASLTSIYGTTSRDGGTTWTPNYPVTDELSFFSFNTIGIPNLGDYNQASANGTSAFFPAWSDQRLSTGDVRTPGTNTFTAGTGPNAVTTKVSFALGALCPPDTLGAPGATVVRHFRIQNSGTVPDTYNYSILDNAGWIVGVANGTTPQLAPSSFFDVFVTVQIDSNCLPPSDLLTMYVQPVGETCYGPQICQTRVLCDLATATELALVSATADPRHVALSWFSASLSGARATVYRQPEGADWTALATVLADASGNFRFEDTNVQPGASYFYKLGIRGGGTEQFYGEASVTVPNAWALALAPAGPNPTTDRLTISFTLPIAAAARLEVLDVAGRVMATRDAGTLGVGQHVVTFTEAARWGPGIYLVRLTQGSSSIVSRACIMR